MRCQQSLAMTNVSQFNTACVIDTFRESAPPSARPAQEPTARNGRGQGSYVSRMLSVTTHCFGDSFLSPFLTRSLNILREEAGAVPPPGKTGTCLVGALPGCSQIPSAERHGGLETALTQSRV